MTRTAPTLAISLALLSFHGGVVLAGGTREAKLLPEDGVAGGLFGRSVAIEGATAVAGALGPGGVGAAYVFDTSTGTQVAKLLAVDGASGDDFGAVVAVSGSTVLVGAPLDDDNGLSSGSAYLFDATTGTQVAKLLPQDGSAGDRFGFAIALYGTAAFVGAYRDSDKGFQSGAVYVFDVATGVQLRKIVPADGVAQDWFGYSLTAQGGTLLVGAPGDDDNGLNSGSAYVLDAATGTQVGQLFPPVESPAGLFGSSVTLDGSLAVVGAFFGPLGSSAGAAFTVDLATGQQLELTPLDGFPGDSFGGSVAVSDVTAIIGAHKDDDLGPNSGSVYLFDTATGSQLAKLRAEEGEENDLFGIAVAASGQTILVGATGDDDGGASSGAVYVFSFERANVSLWNGSGANTLLLANVTPPSLGGDWVVEVDCTGHAASFAYVLAHELSASGIFLAGGELLLDLTSQPVLATGQQHTSNVLPFAFPVPDDPALCGWDATAQAVVFGAPAYELTNALEIRVGL